MRKGPAIACALIAWALLAATVSAQPGGDPGTPGAAATCLVCGMPIAPGEGIVHEHRGRDVHICSPACELHWDEDPGLYFAALQPRSALFDESERMPPRLSNGWLVLGLYVLLGLICGAACAYMAVGRGRPAVPWFFAGLAVNIFAVIALLVRGPGDLRGLPQGVPAGLRKVPVTYAPAACPSCGYANHPSAKTCARCAAGLEPTVASEVSRVSGPEDVR